MVDQTQARPGNRNAAGHHRPSPALRALATGARHWTGYRNWQGADVAPHLGGLTVVVDALDGARPFHVRRVTGTNDHGPTLYAAADPEHAARWVEHVHNFGHPPR